MKKNAIFVFTLFLLSTMAQAQATRNAILADTVNAAGVYAPYRCMSTGDTPAPAGYKPFYVSHYGRHGSRFHSSINLMLPAKTGLDKADSAGILTDEGKVLLKDLDRLIDEHKGLEGMLSPRGAAEHRAIATRLYERVPKAFMSKKRNEVNCVSSTYPRCLISMANFSSALKDKSRSLRFSYTTGDKYMQYIIHGIRGIDTKGLEDSLRNSGCTYDTLFCRLFTDRAKAEGLMSSPQAFTDALFKAGAICDDLDYLGIDIFRHFTLEELIQQANVMTDRCYAVYGCSREWWQQTSEAEHELIADFVKKADAALAPGSHVAADLRFGHDTGILPFVSTLGLEGRDQRLPSAKAHDHWVMRDMVQMGTNFQMIFYRGKKGDVLVKMLDNEKETTIKAVPTFKGPYYRWEDLRAYLVGICGEDLVSE